jgi:hypothetical protein
MFTIEGSFTNGKIHSYFKYKCPGGIEDVVQSQEVPGA